MATDNLINLLNAVKLAGVAVFEANARAADAERAYYSAREDASEAKNALAAAEKALLKAARVSA